MRAFKAPEIVVLLVFGITSSLVASDVLPDYIKEMGAKDKKVKLNAIFTARRAVIAGDASKPKAAEEQYKEITKMNLIKCLDDKDVEIQTAALDVLALGYGTAARDAEKRAIELSTSSDENVRASSVFLLVELNSHDDELRRALIQALGDSSSSVRSRASAGVLRAYTDQKALVEKLTVMLSDNDATVRSNILDAFSTLADIPADALSAISKCNSDADENVREKSVSILKKIRR